MWSWSRLSEFAGLKWDDVRIVGDETHPEIIGKWGVEKWARIPTGLHQELLTLKCESPYVFGAYSHQLRAFYEDSKRRTIACKVGREFNPRAFADWFQARIPNWATATGNAHATPHVFRKTSLQHARVGEDINQRVAMDARLNTSVMMKHYITERDEELRQASNRTYRRILASLPPEVAFRYGYVAENGSAQLEAKLKAATEAGDWTLVAELAAELARQRRQA